MAASGNDVEVRFGAVIDDFKSKMDEVTGVFDKVVSRFKALAVVVGGGEAFKHFIDEANTLNAEAMKLSKTLGITGEEAGSLNTALDDIGTDAEAYTGSFLKFNRALRTNSESMKQLGVDVDGLRSGQKSSNDVFIESLAIVNKYKPGIDQIQVAMQLFGRSVEDVQKLQRLANDVTGDAARMLGKTREELNASLSPMEKYRANLAAAAEKNRELNLTITEEGVKASKEYKEAMNDVGDVLKGLQVTIGQAVIPHFTELAEKLAAIGPTLVKGMQYMTQVLVAAWARIGESVERAWDVISGVVGKIVDGIKGSFGGDGLTAMETFQVALQVVSDTFSALMDVVDVVVSAVGTMLGALVDNVVGLVTTIVRGLGSVVGLFVDGFGGEMPSAMQIFRNALGVIKIAFVAARVGIEEFVNGSQTYIALAAEGFRRFAAIAIAALHLDWGGVKDAWSTGVAESNAILQRGIDKAVAIAKKGKEDIDKAAMGTGAPEIVIKAGTPKGAPTGGDLKADIGKQGKGDATMAAQLALLKAQTEAELALDREYLREAQAIYDDANARGLLSVGQYYDAKLAIELRGIDLSLAAKRREAADAAKAQAESEKARGAAKTPEERNKFDAQAIKFKTDQVKLLGEINVLEAQRNETVRATGAQYEEAERKLAADLTAIRATREKAAADNEIEIDRRVLEQKKALRQIDAEGAFAAQRVLEDRSYAATVAALQAKAAAITGTAAEIEKQRAQQMADEEAAEREHRRRLTEIDNAAVLERAKYSIQAQDSVKGAFKTMTSDLLNGVTKLSDVFRNFAKSIAETFVNLIAQRFTDRLFDVSGVKNAIDSMVNFFVDGIGEMVTKWFGAQVEQTTIQETQQGVRMGAQAIEQAAAQGEAVTTAVVVEGAELAKTGAVEAGAGVRTSTEVAAAATSTSVSLGASIANIGAKAWEAAAAVYAAIAAIPVVGPFLAPAAAFAAGAVVLGFVGKIASSEGGEYRVDQDRLNIVHKDETILPAPFAQGLRDLVGKGGVTPLVSAVDQIVTRLAPQGIRASAPQTMAGAGRPANQDADAQAPDRARNAPGDDPGKPAGPSEPPRTVANVEPVAADAAASLVPRAPAPRSETAKAEPLSPMQRALAPDAKPVPADAAASLVVAKAEPGQVAMPAPERAMASTPANYPTSIGGGSAVGSAAAAPWWRVPSSPLAQIQAQASAPAAPAPAAAEPYSSAQASPIQLVGASAGEFFIANTKHLLDVLDKAQRNGRRPR